MLVVIDAGNTQTKVALISKKNISYKATFLTADLLASKQLLLDFLKADSFRSINHAILCSVVPKLSQKLTPHLKKTFSTFLEVNSSLSLPFKMKYKTPQTLGNDRLCLAAFGWVVAKEKKSSVIIISAGTATTIDVVTPHAYLGGLIGISPSLSLQALSEKTASLPLVPFKRERNVIGNSTHRALVSGAYWGFIGGIIGAVGQIEAKLGSPAIIFASGGNAKLISNEPLLKKKIIVETNAVFKGAKALFDINKK